MKLAISLLLGILCGPVVSGAQVLPMSSGSCGVSSSGTAGCDWLSAGPAPTPSNGQANKQPPAAHQFSVTRFTLSPTAALPRLVCDEDQIIVGLGKGELVNETQAPAAHIPIDQGSVLLMPKEEAIVLRNVGEHQLDVLEICLRPRFEASR
jgi:hypothetical protein